MGLEVFFPDDIRRVLLAAEQSTVSALQASGDGDAYAQGYRAGYRAALTTISLAVGVVLSQPVAWRILEDERILGHSTNVT